MVKVGVTLEETRDGILHRIGSKASDDIKDAVIRLLNDGIIYVTQRANWRFLRRYADFTVTGSESKLPSDCDRIICFRIPGQGRIPTEVGPAAYEMSLEQNVAEYTEIYIISKVEIGPDGTPSSYVKFHLSPGVGTTLRLWYCKWTEKLTEDDLSSVPPFPPHIWDLITRKALLDAMRYAAVSATSIQIEERQFMAMIEHYKAAEDFDGGSYDEMKQDPKIQSYNATKGRQRG